MDHQTRSKLNFKVSSRKSISCKFCCPLKQKLSAAHSHINRKFTALLPSCYLDVSLYCFRDMQTSTAHPKGILGNFQREKSSGKVCGHNPKLPLKSYECIIFTHPGGNTLNAANFGMQITFKGPHETPECRNQPHVSNIQVALFI